MKAVILAAGEGKRLQPLTSTRSKHMIPLAGSPLLEYLLVALRDSGISDILLVTGYYENILKEYFQDGSKWNINLSYVHQNTYLGSAHAISFAEKAVTQDYFLVIYGDLLVHSNAIRSLLRLHATHSKPIISVVPVSDPHNYGVTYIKKGRVTGIIEKPDTAGEGALINAGIYIFPKTIFPLIHTTPSSQRGEYEITDTIQTLIAQGEQFLPNHISTQNWLDIGRPWDLLEAVKRILASKDVNVQVHGDIEQGATIRGPVYIKEGARIRSGAYIEGPSFIGSNSDIGPNSYLRPFSSIEDNVRIGNACEVKNSIILSGTHIGHLSYIGDSIIGTQCNFGAGTITANLRLDEKSIKVRINRRLQDSGRQKLGVIMGDNVKTGVSVQFMPGVKIGPNAWVGPGAQVNKDVPKGHIYIQSLNGIQLRQRRDQ